MPAKLTQKDVDRTQKDVDRTEEDADRMAQQAHDEQQAEEAARELEASRELITSTHGPLTVSGPPTGISGEIDASDIVLPFAKIVQNTSPEINEGYKAGRFLKSSGSETEHLEFVALHIALGRTFYDGDASKLRCSSIDRRTGRPATEDFAAEIGVTMGNNVICRSCPHVNDLQFEKLACKLDYMLTCYDLRTEEPFLFRVKGSAMGKFKQRLIAAVVMGHKPPWFAAWEMTSVLKTNDRKQSWYAPELKPLKFHDDAERATWAAYAQQFAVAPVHEVDPDDLPFE